MVTQIIHTIMFRVPLAWVTHKHMQAQDIKLHMTTTVHLQISKRSIANLIGQRTRIVWWINGSAESEFEWCMVGLIFYKEVSVWKTNVMLLAAWRRRSSHREVWSMGVWKCFHLSSSVTRGFCGKYKDKTGLHIYGGKECIHIRMYNRVLILKE